jgi:integrase
MPVLKNRPPKYAHHRASNQAYVKHRGKFTYLGPYGSSESRRAYARFIALLGSQTSVGASEGPSGPTVDVPAPPTALLIGELALQFYEHAKVYYRRGGKQTGEATTIRACLRPLVNRFGDEPAAEFGARKLKQVREDMIALGWVRYTVNKGTSIVKRFFRWAAEEELVAAHVAGAVCMVKGLEKDRSHAREKEPVKPVADLVVEATLPHVSDIVGAMIRVMRLTGMRPGEVLAMTKAEIDMSDPECWIFSPRVHKTAHRGKVRHVMIGPQCQEVLMPWILKAPTGQIFKIRRDSVRLAINRACLKAGVPHWHPNMIIHLVATEIRAKHGLEAAQVILGHASADITQTYADRDMRKAGEFIRKIG